MSKRKLLLADDSITIQKVVNLTFADEGIEVVAVGDGDSAMRKFEEFMPDLVMADVNMPGLTGYEMCQIIKNNEETQRIPVILLVGSFEPFDETKAQEVGADDYLTKPFQSIRQLVNKVTDLLNRTKEIAANEPAIEPEPAPSEAASALTATSAAAAPHDTFAETLEMPRGEHFRTDFGDAGMDDEMIETSRADYFEPQPITGFQKESEATVDAAKNHPLTAEDLKPFNFSENRAFSEQEAPAENASFQAVETPPEVFQREETNEDFSRRETDREEFEQSAETATSAEFSESAADRSADLYVEPPRQFSDDEEFSATEDAQTVSDSAAEREAVYHSSAGENLDTQNAQYEYQTAEREAAAPENLDPQAVSFEQTGPAEFAEEDRLEPVEPFESTERFESTDRQEQFEPVEQVEASEGFAASEDFQSTENLESAEPGSSYETGISAAPSGEFSSEAGNLSEAAQAAETAAQNQERQGDEAIGTTEAATEAIEPEEIRQSTIATAEKIPVVSFDDDDMLELPPLVEETGIRPPPKPEPPAAEPETIEAPAAEAAPPTAPTIPPEVIESIVRKLAEKISGQVSERISGQVSEMIAAQMPQIAPQVSEMIVEELTREHEVKESEIKEQENNE